MNHSNVSPVILCGGSGTRLWPLSRSAFPKQFLALSGAITEKSLFQEAVMRLNQITKSSSGLNATLSKSIVVTNEDHRFLVLDQLRDLPEISATLLLEPSSRNTAPALTIAAMHCEESSDPILVVSPADQTIQDQTSFLKAINDSINTVKSDSSNKTIVVLGITPTSAETGYGYIKRSGPMGKRCEFSVDTFVEKPNLTIAQQYLADGNYLWNSGMFVLRASTWLAALREFRPDIYKATQKAWSSRTQDHAEQTIFIRPDKEQFQLIPSESIDYAVIEKCPGSQFSVKMVELDAGWSDLGAWHAVWEVGKRDKNNNVVIGDAIVSNSNNSLVHSTSRLLGVVGVDNLVIVETADAVLVADRSNSQDVKKIVAKLEEQEREEKNLHRKVARPWGWYDSVDEGEHFKVKRIQVKPGASLSLQMHHHRAEHWIVVKGIAEVTNGNQVIRLQANESTFIPKGEKHRLANPGSEPLEIIEVQSGSYLGEDDIVRFEDIYKRT